jgi:23S rRNA pseudouridine2605 synthase
MKKKSPAFGHFKNKKSNAAIKEHFKQEKRKWKKEREEYFKSRKTRVGSQESKANSQTSDIRHRAPDLMPLNKFIAHCGVCSRRDAAVLVKEGKVKVNSAVITEPGHRISEKDKVVVNGKPVSPVKNFVYILLNKPKDYITTADDPQKRKTVLNLIGKATYERVYPAGRLDRNTSGVLLMTNDGDLVQQLTHPANEVKKVYAATLNKPLEKKDFEKLLAGITLGDGPAKVDALGYADIKDKTKIGLEIHSGRNRIVRRMFEHLGYEVKGLDRVMFAGLTKKNVARGKWRFLTDKEVRELKYFGKGK